MSAQARTRQWRHRPMLRRQGVLAVALMAGAGTIAAIPPDQSFRVTVALNSAVQSSTVQCSSTLEPGSGLSKFNVVCSPAPPIREAQRYLLNVYRAGEWLGTVDGQMGTGTVISWRIVHVANREYLEMMVGW